MKALPSEEIDTAAKNIASLAESLRGKKILVLGGTGFFGTWLLSTLLEVSQQCSLGIELHVLSRQPSRVRDLGYLPWNSPDIHWHSGSLEDFESPGIHFNYIIHCAAAYDPSPDPTKAIALVGETTAGVLKLIDFMRKFPPQTLLYVSSGAVYGQQPAGISALPEDYKGAPDVSRPSSAYGEAKRISEFLFHQAAAIHGFELKVARCFSFLGPGMPLDGPFAAGNFIRDALEGRTIKIQGDGTPVRSYQHPVDLVTWLIWILVRGLPSETYNVGSNEAVSIKELAERISGIVDGTHIEVAATPEPGRGISRYVPDVSKAHETLGLSASYNLSQSLKSAIKWFQP